jgi:hypothetical protein
MKYSMKYIKQLEQKYFDGLTTDEEEAVLKQYLHEHADGMDELRAVMSYLAVGKDLHAPSAMKPHGAHKAKRRVMTWYAAAAIVVLIIGGATFLGISESSNDVCVAYVNGQKITDSEAVMAQMRESIKQVKTDDKDPTVDDQLGDMMKTLNDN